MELVLIADGCISGNSNNEDFIRQKDIRIGIMWFGAQYSGSYRSRL